MTKAMHGIVRCRTIELREDAGMPDGQGVEILIKPSSVPCPGDGFSRSAGVFADDADFDEIMEEVFRARKLDRIA